MQLKKERPASGHVFRVKRHKGYVWFAKYRLLADRQRTYTYDAEGNLLTRTERATGAVTRFAWGAKGGWRVPFL